MSHSTQKSMQKNFDLGKPVMGNVALIISKVSKYTWFIHHDQKD